MISSNNNAHDLSFLSLWKEKLEHHCILLPSVYGIAACSLLMEFLSFSSKLNREAMLASPDFLFHTSLFEGSLPLNVEHVRKIVPYAQNTAFGSEKVIIIENITTASISALNALLKIIEEPPHNTRFYIIYSDLHAIPETIRSRGLLLCENITHEDHFSSIVDFLNLPKDYQTFIECGYDFTTYNVLVKVKDLTFNDVLSSLQTKKADYEGIFAFLEYQLQKLVQSKPCAKIYEIQAKLLHFRKQVRHLHINEQTVLLQLTEEVYALAV